MLVQPPFDEGAVRTHRQVLASNVVEGEARQSAADTFATEGFECFGMEHDDDIPLASEFGEPGEFTADISFVA